MEVKPNLRLAGSKALKRWTIPQGPKAIVHEQSELTSMSTKRELTPHLTPYLTPCYNSRMLNYLYLS